MERRHRWSGKHVKRHESLSFRACVLIPSLDSTWLYISINSKTHILLILLHHRSKGAFFNQWACLTLTISQGLLIQSCIKTYIDSFCDIQEDTRSKHLRLGEIRDGEGDGESEREEERGDNSYLTIKSYKFSAKFFFFFLIYSGLLFSYHPQTTFLTSWWTSVLFSP